MAAVLLNQVLSGTKAWATLSNETKQGIRSICLRAAQGETMRLVRRRLADVLGLVGAVELKLAQEGKGDGWPDLLPYLMQVREGVCRHLIGAACVRACVRSV